MQRSRKLIIEIKPRHVRVTVVEKGRPTRYSDQAIDSDGPTNATRDAQVAAALRRGLDAVGTRTRKAVLVLDAASNFSTRVILPPVQPAHVPRALRHEARAHIPFALEEVVWDAELFDTNPPEALLVAARKEVVEGLARAAAANGLTIERVTTAPMALANALAAQSESGRGPIVLVAGSDDSIDLVGYDGIRCLPRSLPAGAGAEAVEREVDQLVERLGHAAGTAQRLYSNESEYSVVAGAFLDGPLRLDLSPAATRQRRVARRMAGPRVAGLILALAILGVWIAGFHAWARAERRARGRLAARVESLRRLEQRMKPIEVEIQRDRAAAHSCVRAMERAAGWYEVLREVQSVLPQGMYLLGSESEVMASGARGLRIDVLSYTDREPEGVDPVKALRDALRALPLFSDETRVSSRPSRGAFARVFTLDVVIAEGVL